LPFRLKNAQQNAQKNAGLQGSTLSDHRTTTGFGPREGFEKPEINQLLRIDILVFHL